MGVCNKCGSLVSEEQKFCPTCGAKINNTDFSEKLDDFGEKVKDLNNTPDTTSSYSKDDVENNKVMAVLCYLGILWLVPLLAAKESRFAKFHLNQGLVLFLFSIAVSIVSPIPILGGIVAVVGGIAGCVLFVIGIINAATGKAKELPIIGKLAVKWDIVK